MKYQIDELAKACGVSEQGIRYYFKANSCAKNGKRWNPTDDELEDMFRHYGKDYATFAQDYESTHKEFAQETENNHKEPLNDETAGESAYLRGRVEELEKRIETHKDEIDYLRRKLDESSDANAKLIEENRALTARMILALNESSENKEPESPNGTLEVEPIQETKETESAADAKQKMTAEQWQRLSRWERLKRAWNGVFE